MFRKSFLLFTAALFLAAAVTGVSAAETDCDSVYCFTAGDFSQEENLAGVFITSLPDSRTGTILLGSRVLQPGDILTAQQLEQLTFSPLRTEQDTAAELEFLPIYEGHVAPCTAMTIGIRGKEDKAPVAEDSAEETYKNLELTGRLKAADPENQPMTFTVTRQPKRGTLELKDRNLNAVKAGMLALTQEGSLARYFQDLGVKVGAKTGSAQVSATSRESNAVLICFAPYDDPEIAVAIVAEKGGTGSELGAVASDIFRYYFDRQNTNAQIQTENTLAR